MYLAINACLYAVLPSDDPCLSDICTMMAICTLKGYTNSSVNLTYDLLDLA